jgi:iron complex outermembrane receptor protein
VRRLGLCLGLGLWLALPAAAQESGVVSGRVVDAATGTPVSTAAVRVVGTVLLTIADDSGRFELRGVPPGRRRLWVERIGYAPRELEISVSAGARAELEIALEPRAVALGSVVVAATKRELSTRDAPVSVAVLEDDELRLRVPATVADAVAYAPSVQFVGENINIRGSSGYSRGTGTRVLFLLDGVPANAGDSGGINWDIVPLTEVSRVEVVKGAGSALYGTSALGGVVNVVTAEPPERPITRVRLRGGFYDDPPQSEWIWANQTLGYYSAEASHGRHLGPLGVWLRGGWGTDDGFRENGDLERMNAALRLRLGGAADTLSLFGSWAREDYGAPIVWCTRGQCDDPNGLAFQPLRVPDDARDDRTRSDKGRIHLTHRRRWSGPLSSFGRLSFQRNDWESDFGDQLVWALADRYGGELRLGWQTASWLFLTLGAEGAYTDIESNLFQGVGEEASDTDYDIRELAVFAQGELGLGSWVTLTAGVRTDIWRARGDTLADPSTSELSPRLGLVIAPDALTRVRASVGRGFRAPSASELYTATRVAGFEVERNPSLQPEQSWAGEVGIQRLLTSWLLLDVAGFYYDFEDLIEGDTLFSEGAIKIRFQNLPKARVAGLEALARISLFRERLQGHVAYTFLDTEDISTGEPLAYRPEHLLTASGTLLFRGLEIGVDYRYASAFERVQVFTGPRLDALVPMRELDVGLAYRLGRQTLRFMVDNALNYAYTTIERNLQPIRRYTAALELEF